MSYAEVLRIADNIMVIPLLLALLGGVTSPFLSRGVQFRGLAPVSRLSARKALFWRKISLDTEQQDNAELTVLRWNETRKERSVA